MRFDLRRVLLIALVLGVGGGVVAKRLLSSASPVPERAPATSSPILDVGDPQVRRMLEWVRSHGGSLIGDCDIDQPNRMRIAAVPGYRPDSRLRDLWITHQDDGASLEYFDRAFPHGVGESDTIHAKVGITSVERAGLDRLVAEAGYPATIAPVDGVMGLDCGTRLVESCQEGRYYVAMRSCGVGTLDVLTDSAFAFARERVAARGKAVAPVAVTFDGQVTVTRHGSFLRVDGSEKSYVLIVPAAFAANADIERLFALGGGLRAVGAPVRGRFTGFRRGPASEAWFELHSAENLEYRPEAD